MLTPRRVHVFMFDADSDEEEENDAMSAVESSNVSDTLAAGSAGGSDKEN